MRPLFPLLCFLTTCAAYKMVIIAPATANSQVGVFFTWLRQLFQVIFNKRVAEALAAAGHDVTLALIYNLEGLDASDVKISKDVKGKLTGFY